MGTNGLAGCGSRANDVAVFMRGHVARAYTQYLQIPVRKSSTAIRERRVKPSLMYAQMPPRVASSADVPCD